MIPRASYSVALTALICSLSGCAGEGTPSSPRGVAPELRDSAGVTLFEHPAEVLVAMPLLVADTVAPLAAFGGADSGMVDISGIFTFALLRDGSLVGFHRRDAALVTFTPDGRERRRDDATSLGTTPFGLIAAVSDLGGDTVLVTDLMNARFVVAHPDTGLVREVPGVFRDGTEFHSVVGRFDNGAWLLRPGYLTGAEPQVAQAELPPRRKPMAIGLTRQDEGGPRFDTLVMVPGWELVRAQQPVNGVVTWLDMRPQYAARPHVVMWGKEAAVITNADRSVARYDENGVLRSIIRINAPLSTPTDSVRSALATGLRREAARTWAGHVDSAQRIMEVDSIVGTVVFADSIAPYERMHLAPGRRLWLQEAALAPGDPVRLIGFEPDGTIVGRLEVPLPPGGSIAAMGDDRVVVRVTVPEGRSYVRVWGIREQRTEN